jgi:hypothetical protein
MAKTIERREFLQLASGSCMLCGTAGRLSGFGSSGDRLTLISPGSRTSRVRVAKLYLGIPKALWPDPKMDLKSEIAKYQAEFERMKKDFADVEFVADALVTSPADLDGVSRALEGADGVLAIHLSMGVTDLLKDVLKRRRPTMLFAAPYSGHEWTQFGALRKEETGALLECMLTSDYTQLAAAVRPFRAIHHLREGRIINISTRAPDPAYLKAIGERFGTEIRTVGREAVLAAYESIPAADAEAETERWVRRAQEVVEPPREEIFRSCRLALAFEKFLDEMKGTVLTVDCYGSMYRRLPAFPCVGFVRLNDMGLGGICESDLASAMTHALLQGLSGKPAFISDPTMDESVRGIILAHCLGSTRMDGPDGEAAPYRLRTIMERQEGCVPQVRMRLGQKVTQARMIGAEKILYFTGEVMDVPRSERGCRTQITVRVDGDPEKLWQNWSHGLHRSTVYGDLTADLRRFSRFKGMELIHEA